MEANLQSDFTVIDGFLRKVMELMEYANSSDAQKRLGEALLRHYKTNGELEFRVVQAKCSGDYGFSHPPLRTFYV